MILRSLIRAVYGVDVFEAVAAAERARDWFRNELALCSQNEREAEARARRFWRERDAARDQVVELTADLDMTRKTNALLRSLVAILRDCNREMDERNVYLEQLHGMTPGERLAAAENDAPNRCTKSKTVTVPLPKADEVQYRVDAWQIHGTSRWGVGVAIDVEWLDRRLSKLEDEACHQ
jgi:hypothetical protein